MTKTFIDLGAARKAPAITETPRAGRLRLKRAAGQMETAAYDHRTTELLTMLRSMRPAGSIAERDFVEQWVTPLGCDIDGYGNHWKVIGDSRILWSCHTDTVHKFGGAQYVGFQDGCAYVTRSNCLGADDTVGVWLMRQMILAGVPGVYVFHRAEEVGGLGSRWVLDNDSQRLADLDFAIAFDRKGYSDIITDQMGTTASVAFADSLAEALWPLPYAPADGVFTDTQVYSEVIPECSNISVGYHAMHTVGEWQDVDYAMRLLEQMLQTDFSSLVATRDPQADTLAKWDDFDIRYGWKDCDPWPSDKALTMDQFCRRYPDVVSDFLTSCGFSVDELKEYGGID